jgi:hypothetical protein
LLHPAAMSDLDTIADHHATVNDDEDATSDIWDRFVAESMDKMLFLHPDFKDGTFKLYSADQAAQTRRDFDSATRVLW